MSSFLHQLIRTIPFINTVKVIEFITKNEK